jgi:hypothetical protein
MTCDDVLPALELGDAAQQDAARQHARDCPACAAAVGRWLALKSALADAPALTDQERALWRAARQGSSPRVWRPRLWVAGAAAVAATVLVALLWPRPAPPPTPGPSVEALAFSAERSGRELAAFGRQLDQVDRELAALSERIVLAEARRMAAGLAEQYHR